MCAILKTDAPSAPSQNFIHIYLCFYTSEGESIMLFPFFLPSLINACLKEKAAIVQGPAGGLWSMQCGLIKSWGRLKCQAIIILFNAGLCLALVPVALQLCVFIPLSPASCSLSDVCAIWSGSTSVDILLQSWDSSSLCTASLCAPRHLPWLKTLYHTKKGSPLIVSTAKCGMLCCIYLNIIYVHWDRCGSALEYQIATTIGRKLRFRNNLAT